MEAELTLPILPKDAITNNNMLLDGVNTDDDPFPFIHYKTWGLSARSLLSALLSNLTLERDDEIAILTTTNWRYVSTCLSITSFNFCRISRVVTNSTKVVIVVHEFGYPYRDIEEDIINWHRKGIIVIEDCAHVVGLKIQNKYVGSFGDYTLVSLPKLFPVNRGGILLSKKKISLDNICASDDECRIDEKEIKSYKKFLYSHKFLSKKRVERHILMKNAFEEIVWEPSAPSIPFATYLKIKKRNLDIPGVQFVATLSTDYCLIPTNPFVHKRIFNSITKKINQQIA